MAEKFLDQLPDLRRTPLVRAEHEFPGVLPGEVPLAPRDRGVPVPLVQLLPTKQPPLDAVVADANVVSSGDRLNQRLHRCVRRLVGQVARGDPAWEMTQTVVDGFL